MKLTLPYPPSLNKMYRTVRGMILISKEGRAYKKKVWKICRDLKVKPIMSGPIKVVVEAYRPRRTGDLDNVFKGIFDALNKNCYRDDGQIIEIHARRFDDKLNPRVEIEVTSLEDGTAGNSL